MEPITFLKKLWAQTPGGQVELRAIPVKKDVGQAVVREFERNSVQITNFAETYGKRGSGYGVYFGVCKRDEDNDGTKASIARVPALWADIDTVKDGIDTEATLRLLNDLPLNMRPTAAVHSGGGIHAYWFLNEPCENVEAAEQVNKVLQLFVGGDNVHDVTRILRLPGTYNNKRAPKKVEVVWCQDFRRFDIHDLSHAVLSSKQVLDGASWGKPKDVLKKHTAHPTQTTTTDQRAAILGKTQGRKLLEDVWQNQVRYHAPRGYMGLHEAIVMTTAYLHCIDIPQAGIVNLVMQRIKSVHERDADGETWNWEAERAYVLKTLETWIPKWDAIKGTNKQTKRKGR